MQAIIRFRDTADNQRLKKVCDYFKLSGKSVKEQYCSRVLRAEQLFFYHPVYNPNSKEIAYFINPNVSSNLNSSSSRCDDDRYKISDECGLVGDLSIRADDYDDDNRSSYPEISMNELLKLGGTAQEVACPLPQSHNNKQQRQQQQHSEELSIDNVKQSSSSSSSSSIAIKDLCEGVYYIKDHEYIQPNYPWHNLASNGLRPTCSHATKSLRHELMRSVNHLQHHHHNHHHVIQTQTQSDSKYVQKSLSFPSSLSTAMLTNMTRSVVSSSSSSTCDNNNQFAPSFNKPQSAHNIYTSSSAQMNKANNNNNTSAGKRSYQEAFNIGIPQPSASSICIPQPSTSIAKKLDIFQSFKYSRQQQQQPTIDCTPNYRQSAVIATNTCKRRNEATVVTPSVDDDDDSDGIVNSNSDNVSDQLSDVLLPSTVVAFNKELLPTECTVYDLTGDDTTHRTTIEVDGRNDDMQIAVASDCQSTKLTDERHGDWMGEVDDKENELLSIYDLVVDSDRADHDDDSAKHHDYTYPASSTVYITPDPSLRQSSAVPVVSLKSSTISLLHQKNNHIRIRTNNVVTATKRKMMGLLRPSLSLANTAMGDSYHGATPSSKLTTNIQPTQMMHIASPKSMIHSSSSSSSSSSRSPASNKNKRGRVDTLTRRGSLGGTASIRSFFQRVI